VADITTRPPSVISLIEADAELARAVPHDELPLAHRALTLREVTVAAGEPMCPAAPDTLGLLLVSGAFWREVQVGQGGAPQLFGPGAIVLHEPPPAELLSASTLGVALVRSRLAVLDRRLLLASTRWPGIAADVLRRLAEQERDLAVQAAICQLPRVDERLHALLWHLAGRWGRVGADGVRLGLRLTHATLGRFVGARRPTVSLALGQLRDRGLVERDSDGTWMLRGAPPALPVVERTAPPDLFAGTA
jgi:CRP-like cAMP-binding protein